MTMIIPTLHMSSWWRDGITCSVSYIGFEMMELGWKLWLQSSRAFSLFLSTCIAAHGECLFTRGMKIHQHIYLGKLRLRICFLTISSRRNAILSPYPHFRSLLMTIFKIIFNLSFLFSICAFYSVFPSFSLLKSINGFTRICILLPGVVVLKLGWFYSPGGVVALLW